jgi:molybdopterin converting factor subunit 1
MKVKVKFFAVLRERAGTAGAIQEIKEGSTVRELWEILQRDYPQLAQVQARILYAVNLNYVNGDHILKDEDEVVFVPPVSGG